MHRQMTATELKAKLLGVLDDVAHGDEVEITKHGHTVARLVPARGKRDIRDMFAGQVTINAGEEELLSPTDPDAWEYD